MLEAIHKLQPNRTIHLRGFDDRGAAAALHSCTENSFTVSGVFRDSADFCVLVLYDADDFFGHPSIQYLPSFDFSGVTLAFDVEYSALMALNSSLFPSIDWPYLDVIREDGTTAQIRLVPAGGSASSWHVSLDFEALGVSRIRQAWLTFAPPIPPGVAYPGGEWSAIFTAWTVSGPASLQVAGSGSVRVEETDAWCTYTGAWTPESGFYSKGFAAVTSSGTVTVRWHCQSVHDLYLGTALYVDRGIWGISIDGGAETELDCHLISASQLVTRRKIAGSLSSGTHSATLRHKSGGPVYFDFLEASVASDVPDAAVVYSDRTAANDYGTDHAYKLSPQRLLWMMDKLGLAGPMNVYVSVFWWNQRRVDGRFLPSVTVQIPPAAVATGNNVFVSVGGSVFGYFVLFGDTPAIVATGIAASVNATAVGVRASSAADVLTIVNRSAALIYSFTFEAWYEIPPATAHNAITVSGALTGGVAGKWVIDEAVDPVLNVAASAWLRDLCAECAARGRELTLAYSIELLNPPAAWAARYPDGTAVETSTGFGTNVTTHCAFGSGVLDYQKRAYLETAAIMAAAGLTPRLQFGEFVWWYFAGSSGMAFYDDGTKTAALASLGRALYVFAGPDDNPGVNDGADASFLRRRLNAHCAAIRDHVRGAWPAAVFELLLPLDVAYPSPVGRYGIGGRLNHYVSIPSEFPDPATAPFDALKIEALDFGASTHSLDLARWAMQWGTGEALWPRVSYLLPWFNGSCPWEAETVAALDAGIAGIVLFAFDHLCLFGWDLAQARHGETAELV